MPLQIPQTKANAAIVLEPFKWLFFALFEDGHYIAQTQEDKCLSRVDGTGSAFTDVLAYQSKSKLIAFELRHVDGRQAATVDLVQGYFIVNGTPIVPYNQNFEPNRYPLEVVYFRETRVDQNLTGTVQEDKSIKETKGVARHYVNRYFIGWQCIVNGRNKQATIAVG